jgi:hypothetical protein
VSSNIQSLFFEYEKSLNMTSFSVTSIKKAISEFQKDSAKFPTQQKSDPLFPSGRPPVSIRFWQLSVHPYGRQGNTSGRSSMFEKNPDFLCRHGSEKTACNRPDTRTTPSGRGLNMETREARYGKTVAKFTVWTLYASVRTPPRKIRISGDLDLLNL